MLAPGHPLVVMGVSGSGKSTVASALAARHGHFMPSSLQASQQSTLEPLAPDEAGVVVNVAAPVEDRSGGRGQRRSMLSAYDWRIVTATPAPEDVFLDVAQHPDRTVVAVSGEIDVRSVPALRHALFDPRSSSPRSSWSTCRR